MSDDRPLPAPTREEISGVDRQHGELASLLTYACWQCEHDGGNWIEFRGTKYRRTTTGDWEIVTEEE